MTPLERAKELVARYAGALGVHPGSLNVNEKLRGWIHAAIVEATNAEVERRRAVEAERDKLQRIVDAFAGGRALPLPGVLDCGEKHLRLRILNPATGDWWEFSATKEGEVGHHG